MTLIDKDRVEEHNLNRQAFTAADIGTQKVDALARRLLSINPSASIRAIDEWVTPQNAASYVSDADIVFGTIDFLSLEGLWPCTTPVMRKRSRSLRRCLRGGELAPSSPT
jgi:tRNA A37 threonylcarbamoyladenosine dehydratase